MASIAVKNANGDVVYLEVSSGTGTELDPYVSKTTVSATNLDIRDLSSSTDSVSITDGGGSITVDGTVAVSGTLPVSDNGSSLTVDGSVSLATAIPAGTNNIGDVDIASITAGENHIGEIGGNTNVISASFTRPADTTAYAAGDAVTDSTSSPTVITFSNVSRINNGSGVITRVQLVDSANQSTAGQFELWLFDTTYTPDNDNAVFTPTDAECQTLIGIVPLTVSYIGDATSGAGGNRVYVAANLNIPFRTGASSRNLFGALVVRNAYTPVSAEVFHMRLGVLLD